MIAVAADARAAPSSAWPARRWPSKRTCPSDDPTGRADQAQHREHRDALARARLADEPEHLAPADAEVDAVDRLHDAVGREEPRPQAGDLQERPARPHLLSLGSRASRRPSPSRLKASTLIMIMQAGEQHEEERGEDLVALGGQHRAPLGGGRLHAEAEERQRRHLEHGGGDAERGLHHERGEGVRADPVPEDARGCDTPRARSAATKSCSRIDSTLARTMRA